MELGIEYRGAGKTYGKGAAAVEAVRGVTFTVARHEFVTMLGPSGCGKSTLLMMAAGLEPISTGSVLVDGQPVSGPRPGTGVIFQDSTLLPWKTALSNILFPTDIARRPRADYLDRAHELLAAVGLEGAANRKPGQLSGGMRQRVAICRALCADPGLLLMDEPFSALDAISRDEMNELMLTLWEKFHKTALFVTHSIREAVLLSDRVIVLGDKPARVLENLVVPFARPRSIDLSETKEFNELCAHLRVGITLARKGAMAA
jgi:NitT/TauT family transport system ATP-binding protein